jgi:hypothetical protein
MNTGFGAAPSQNMHADRPLLALAMAFAGLLVVANLIAVKIVSVGSLSFPAAVVAYPFTFLVTDVVSEVYGRQAATRIVWIGFAVSVGIALLVLAASALPPAPFWPHEAAYDTILGPVPRIITASMVAYLLSQHHDVFAFHRLRTATHGRHLWLRNNLSTMVSQAIDSAVFITLAFAGTMALSSLAQLMLGQYIVKAAIALADTPLCYLFVSRIRAAASHVPNTDCED